MRATPAFILTAILASVLFPTPATAQQKGGEDETGAYDPVPGFPQPIGSKGHVWGSQGGVFAETPDRIFIANRGELLIPQYLPKNYNGFYGSIDVSQTMNGASRRATPPDAMRNCIVILDGNGKIVESWTQWDHLFDGGGTAELGRGPHAIKISPYDPERRVWVVDDIREAIFVFSHDGKKLLMTLGEPGVPGTDEKHFGDPTDIAFLPDGNVLVSDGYVNTRVMKFDKNGKFLMTWGKPDADKKHPQPGELSTPHGIATSKDGRVFVADRGNQRIQVFDQNGEFLDQWPGLRSPYAVYMSDDQHLWVADGDNDKILGYDLNGKLLYAWGVHGTGPGQIWGPHGLSVDSDGNLYVAETYGGRTQKFHPKPGADAWKIAGKPQPLMPLKAGN